MTIYLRNENNRTVVDMELWENKESGMDLRVATNLRTYSEILLNNIERKDEVIEDFNSIDEMRGWFHEVYMEMAESPNFKEAREEVEAKLFMAAKKYNLHIVTD